ncbi:GNAT family N-acetyltransferase [Sphaerisporangium corydalis]|uniref:GNAT family N-acetyltransferase n=1 Tax=Sphaerisporangium corydalis TaxID=1441875 RepID=A0ABV9E8R9_9ACTN|nr:GNAT family N-acetyltransferase [Sphaerisporangium corydalis]
MSGLEMVRGLQERAARALPAERVEDAGGWWLRHAPRCAWWVGTVLPHADAAPGELTRRVAEAEDFYAALGAPTRFQVSPPACPETLDTILAARGYRLEGPVAIQTAPTTHILNQTSPTPALEASPAPALEGKSNVPALEEAPSSKEAPTVPGSEGALTAPAPESAANVLRIRLDEGPTHAWFEVWHAVQGHGGDPRAEWDLLGRVEGPRAYASALLGDEVVAVGRTVADTGWAGVFGMATLPQARGRGAARAVLAALAGWAAAHDAPHMYLQVECDNTPALRLYERAGFTELCAYHYRTTD